MKRELKLRVEANAADNFQTVIVGVEKQTHRRNNFGNARYCVTDDMFVAKNGVRLISMYVPGYQGTGPVLDIFVCGNLRDRDNTFKLPVDKLPALLEAVEDYNKTFDYKEPKILKIKGEPVAPLYQEVRITVVEQSHRGLEFGENKLNNFTSSAGVTIASNGFPFFNPGRNEVFVRGHNKDADGWSIKVPVLFYPELLKAVEEYNSYFATEASKEEVKPSNYQPTCPLTEEVKVTVTSKTEEKCSGRKMVQRIVQDHYISSHGKVGTVAEVIRENSFGQLVVKLEDGTVALWCKEYSKDFICPIKG